MTREGLTFGRARENVGARGATGAGVATSGVGAESATGVASAGDLEAVPVVRPLEKGTR